VPLRVIVGGVVSCTVIVLFTVVEFPYESVALYVTVWLPTTLVFKEEESIVTFTELGPSTADAPASTYAEYLSITCGFEPFRVITGGVVS
jgi:hypothetical protein